MIILNSTSDVLRVITSTANALDSQLSYVDVTTTSVGGNRQNQGIASITTTNICSAPAASTQRNIKRFTLCAKGGSNTLVLQLFDGTTPFQLLGGTAITLNSGETLEYEDGNGFTVFDATGAIKQVLTPTISGHVIRDNGTARTQRTFINMVNSPTLVFSATDDAANDETELSGRPQGRGTDNTGGATITLGDGDSFDLITSTTAITAFTFTSDFAGRVARIRVNTIRTLTHNATSLIILQTGANITTAVGDTFEVESLGGGNVRIRDYERASALPLTPVTNAALATMAANTIKAEATGSAAAPQDIALAVQSLLLRAAGNIVNAAATTGQFLGRSYAGGDLSFQALPGLGVLLRAPQILTATNAAFAHPTGTRLLVVQMVGGGGGGGGCSTTAGAGGNGGNAANWGMKSFTSISGTSNITIGAAGTTGSNAAGGNGGDSSFVHNAVTLTVRGGTGGALFAGAGTLGAGAQNTGNSANVGADLSIVGISGAEAFRNAAVATSIISGEGGSGPLGEGGRGQGGVNAAGRAATGFGAGGGGAANTTTVAAAGGAATAGACIIWEFG